MGTWPVPKTGAVQQLVIAPLQLFYQVVLVGIAEVSIRGASPRPTPSEAGRQCNINPSRSSWQTLRGHAEGGTADTREKASDPYRAVTSASDGK